MTRDKASLCSDINCRSTHLRAVYSAVGYASQPDLWDECSGKCGVCDLILQALESVDADVRVSMVENIVITGGSSALPGLAPRLRYELQTTTPSHLRQRIIVRVVKPQDLTHRCVDTAEQGTGEVSARQSSTCVRVSMMRLVDRWQGDGGGPSRVVIISC